MANVEDKEKSLFRSAIDTASSTILNSAFPQLNTFIQAMTNRQNKMEGEDEIKNSSTSDREASSIQANIMEEGFQELNSTLQVTNIILTSQLEEQTKGNQLLEKLVVSVKGGSGGGGISPLQAIEDVAAIKIAQKIGTSLLSVLTSSEFLAAMATGVTSLAAGVIGGLGAHFLASNRENILEEQRAKAAGLTIDEYKKQEPNRLDAAKKSGMSPEDYKEQEAKKDALTPIISNQTILIDSLHKQLDEMKKDNRDTTKIVEKIADLEKARAELEKTRSDIEKRLKDVDNKFNKPEVSKTPDEVAMDKLKTAMTTADAGRLALQAATPSSTGYNPYNITNWGREQHGGLATGQQEHEDSSNVLNKVTGGNYGGSGTKAKGALAKNQQEAYKAFKDLGYSDDSARVAVAGLSGESLKKPDDIHPDASRSNPNQKAHGIASWDDVRSEAIKKQFGKMPNEMSIPEQVKALDWELKNKSSYKETYNALHNDKMTGQEKMQAFVQNFERPANVGGEVNKRMGFYHGFDPNSASAQVDGGGPGKESGDQVVNRLQAMKRSGLVTNEQCVSLAAASVGLKPGQWNVHNWDMSHEAKPGSLPIGTPVATHMDDQRNQSSKYAGGGSGTPGANKDHAAVIIGYEYDKSGNVIGMKVAEQYSGSGGIKTHTYYYGKGGATEQNASNYAPIYGPDGKPLGGKNNPLYRQQQMEAAKHQEEGGGKEKALLAAGTNDWADKNKSYQGVKDSLQALKDKGYEPTLVLPNKNVRGKSDAYDGALKAAQELKVNTEYPSSFGQGENSIHMSSQAASELKKKYSGAYVTGDSNSIRLGAKEGESGFTGKGSEFIAQQIKENAKIAKQTIQQLPKDDQAAYLHATASLDNAAARHLHSNKDISLLEAGDDDLRNAYKISPHIAQLHQSSLKDMADSRKKPISAPSVKESFNDHGRHNTPLESNSKKKADAGNVAPPDTVIKKLFSSYGRGGIGDA